MKKNITNPNNNVLTAKEHRIWSRRKSAKTLIGLCAGIIGIGGGIGVGYGIWYNSSPKIQEVKNVSYSLQQIFMWSYTYPVQTSKVFFPVYSQYNYNQEGNDYVSHNYNYNQEGNDYVSHNLEDNINLMIDTFVRYIADETYTAYRTEQLDSLKSHIDIIDFTVQSSGLIQFDAKFFMYATNGNFLPDYSYEYVTSSPFKFNNISSDGENYIWSWFVSINSLKNYNVFHIDENGDITTLVRSESGFMTYLRVHQKLQIDENAWSMLAYS